MLLVVKRAFALSLLLASTSFASADGFSGDGFGTPGFFQQGIPAVVPSTYIGLGDVATYTHEYGLFAYNATQATAHQKLIKVLNTSSSETCDILAASAGGFGNVATCSGGSAGTAAATFCGVVGSTGAGVCTTSTTYDLVGAADLLNIHLAAVNTPLVFNCFGANTPPCLVPNAASLQNFFIGTWAAQNQPYTFSAAFTRANPPTTANIAVIGNANISQMGGGSVGSSFMYAGSVSTVRSMADNTWHAMQGTYNGGSSFLNLDGTDNAQSTPGAGAISGSTNATTLFANGLGTGALWTGNYTEGGYLIGASSPAERHAICHVMTTHAPLGLSC